MKPNLKNDVNRQNRLFSQFAAQKKKTIIALCLIGLMAFMWVRVLGKKTQQSAEAAMIAQQAGLEAQSNPQLKISFIDLPKVTGRNDVLTRNFFDAKDWRSFLAEKEGENLTVGQEGNIVSGDDSEGIVRRIAQQLKLRAIGFGKNPQAFINNKLLGVGDKLFVTVGVNSYECQIVAIEENMVLVGFGQAKIKLKLATMP